MGVGAVLAPILGGLLGGGLSNLAGSALASHEASKNRDFQERMYKHRYQFQMQDMKAAGLNPMLAMGSSPPGAPSGATAKSGELLAQAGAQVQSAFQAAFGRKQGLLLQRNEILNKQRLDAFTVKQMEAQWHKTQVESAAAMSAKNVTDLNTQGLVYDMPRKQRHAEVYTGSGGKAAAYADVINTPWKTWSAGTRSGMGLLNNSIPSNPLKTNSKRRRNTRNPIGKNRRPQHGTNKLR